MRIGVFICWCGSNIAGTVDVESLSEKAKFLPDVYYSEDVKYMCSEIGQESIKKAIKEQKLERVVIGSCSPRMHEETFQEVLKDSGLNPYYVEIANLREQCSWVHDEGEETTQKAFELVEKAVAKIRFAKPLTTETLPVTKRALVVGGGIAGIQSALDIAEAGYEVDLVENTPSLGGRMAQLDKTFPTLDCSACILTPKMVEASSHPNIRLLTYAEIEDVSGFVGNFDIKIRQKAKSIDHDKCTGCGDCTEKCPAKIDNEFEEDKEIRKAVYTPFPQAVPNKPVIDRDNCRYFQKGKCKVCQKVCPAEAVDYEQEDEIIEERYGGVILATGFDQLKPEGWEEFGYGAHPDVITSLELERMFNSSGPTGGKVVCPSTGREPKRVVFIQCVGSRDKNKGNAYCSKVCCLYTAKHTLLLKEKLPDTESFVFYIDIRTAGKSYEEFYERARSTGAKYLKGHVSKVETDGKELLVRSYDNSIGEQIEVEADLVVLASAIKAKGTTEGLAQMFGATGDKDGFLSEAHPKLKPVETQTAGVFLAGACQGPNDIPDTVGQAGAAASKIIGLFNRGEVESLPTTAEVDASICSGCLKCEPVCPVGAISSEQIEEKVPGGVVTRQVAGVNNALCRGCGACTAACRNGAMNLKGYTHRELLAEVDNL
ncbi:CoB--CoM heterodisulfide reductase iron-sulfur subunit A family protein [Natranaerofaba carboxydovora]|uniref:CoB--CoM heterodisulfide reductase iron-sulfur subunit A family protein n=1 Tax=Natranaerofaba carboxydovora TaxID=2742683 RepID=UPI001F12CED8|nr:CoB--CoM heterodisulfide reductase iron-sulfur subunit A family protein [Natranaerofaba carboxydovora]UMZ75461.1 Pyridine nucleotide-disulfide oxidoreductase [Natranaerofaba carboxydovora]